MKTEVFSLAKYENANEDCYHIPNIASQPIVLCDGASESYASARWAKILAENLPDHSGFSRTWLDARIRQFETGIKPDELSWSKRMAYDRGSFSTFLSAQFKDGKCLINAIGDTVAFSLNSEKILDSCPYHSPDQFNSRPILFCTRPELNPSGDFTESEPPYTAELDLAGASHVLLLTDALAHWLMRKNSANAISRLLAIKNDSDFQTFVTTERKRDLRFDDTTMIRIQLAEFLPALLPASGSQGR